MLDFQVMEALNMKANEARKDAEKAQEREQFRKSHKGLKPSDLAKPIEVKP